MVADVADYGLAVRPVGARVQRGGHARAELRLDEVVRHRQEGAAVDGRLAGERGAAEPAHLPPRRVDAGDVRHPRRLLAVDLRHHVRLPAAAGSARAPAGDGPMADGAGKEGWKKVP